MEILCRLVIEMDFRFKDRFKACVLMLIAITAFVFMTVWHWIRVNWEE